MLVNESISFHFQVKRRKAGAGKNGKGHIIHRRGHLGRIQEASASRICALEAQKEPIDFRLLHLANCPQALASQNPMFRRLSIEHRSLPNIAPCIRSYLFLALIWVMP